MTVIELAAPSPCRVRRVAECDSCGRTMKIHAFDWCKACYMRWYRAGCPESGPPPCSVGRVEEYFELTREQYYTLPNAAARMGISERTAWRYEARIRESERDAA